MLYSSAARGKVVCDPVCEHRFRSCHTVYYILSIDDTCYWTTPSFVEPLTLHQMAWRAFSWCRRTSLRPPHDIENSSHTDYTAPCHCQATLLSKLLQSSLNLHFLFGAIFSTGLYACAILYLENMENSAQVIRRTLAIIQ